MLIGLHGRKRVGKDTVAAILCEEAGFTRFAFADPMRESLLALDPYATPGERLSALVGRVGWDRAKVIVPEVRRLLERYGTEAHRDIPGFAAGEPEDFWIDVTRRRIAVDWKRWQEPTTPNIVISDVRFQNEADWITSNGGVLWEICRDGCEGGGHVSNSNVIYCQSTFYNNGTINELADSVLGQLAEIGGLRG